MFRELRPVGERVLVNRNPVDNGADISALCGAPVSLFASGTAALAAALLAAKRHAQVDLPEVVLPAYGCPDLISAADYAGVKPRLVDFEFGRPWMSLQGLADQINENTVAVLAVNFLGIPERIAQIKALVGTRKVAVIEDSAQYFPATEALHRGADLVILSFGKGKPVNLLHGGAVISQNPQIAAYLPKPDNNKGRFYLEQFKYFAKIGLYNQIVKPSVYWLLKYMPFLHLGETIYKPLSGLGSMLSSAVGLLPANIAAYRKRGTHIKQQLQQQLSGLDKEIIDLADACNVPAESRLLRYPILAGSAGHRDHYFNGLEQAGLGVSKLYPAVLPVIKGVKVDQVADNYPNAVDFAGRLLTLPCHSDIKESDLLAISQVILQINQEASA